MDVNGAIEEVLFKTFSLLEDAKQVTACPFLLEAVSQSRKTHRCMVFDIDLKESMCYLIYLGTKPVPQTLRDIAPDKLHVLKDWITHNPSSAKTFLPKMTAFITEWRLPASYITYDIWLMRLKHKDDVLINKYDKSALRQLWPREDYLVQL